MNKRELAAHFAGSAKADRDTKTDQCYDFPGGLVLLELKDGADEYLSFVSSEFIVCDVCGKMLRLADLPEHVELVHYDPPERVWSKGPRAGWRKNWRQI
jgi:hypothetical protein